MIIVLLKLLNKVIFIYVLFFSKKLSYYKMDYQTTKLESDDDI